MNKNKIISGVISFVIGLVGLILYKDITVAILGRDKIISAFFRDDKTPDNVRAIIIVISVVLIIIGIIIIFNSLFNKEKHTDIKQVNKIICSSCGKQYSNRSSGEYCEECGNKL